MQYNRTVGYVNIQLDTKRIDENLKRAQNLLDSQVLDDMENYIPIQAGDLRSKTHIVRPGLIETNTPYAHYQYTGIVYGPNIPKYDKEGNLIGFWSPPEKHPTGRPLHYHEPGTSDHWFERAKETHGKQWLKLVKREAGKG